MIGKLTPSKTISPILTTAIQKLRSQALKIMSIQIEIKD
jgi:hypothetical protein